MKKLALLLYSFIACYNCTAQCAEGARVYALSRYYKDVNYLVHFNASSYSADTVIKFGRQLLSEYYTAIDAYNGRFFTWVEIDSITGNAYKLAEANLNTKTVQYHDHIFTKNEAREIEYDMFANAIVIKCIQPDSLKMYDLATGDLSGICALPLSGATTYSKSIAYNSVEQKLVYLDHGFSPPNDTIFLRFADVIHKKISANFPLKVPGSKIPGSFTYDTRANRIIAVLHWPGDLDVAEINDSEGVRVIGQLKQRLNHHLHNQLAVFDGWKNCYYYPYYTKSGPMATRARFAIVDAPTGRLIDSMNSFDGTHTHQYYGAYDPVCKLREDSTLIVTYGNSYEWYRNGLLIPGATAQVYRPEREGYYKARVTFTCGRAATSNDVYIGGEGTKPTDDEVRVIGNVISANEDGYLLFKNDGYEHTLKIYNGLGQLVQAQYHITTNYAPLRKGALASGMYYYRLFRMGKTISAGKIVVR